MNYITCKDRVCISPPLSMLSEIALTQLKWSINHVQGVPKPFNLRLVGGSRVRKIEWMRDAIVMHSATWPNLTPALTYAIEDKYIQV